MRQETSHSRADSRLITKQNHSIEAVREVFEAAFFECHVDQDDDLIVFGEYRVIVKCNPTMVQLNAIFPAQKGASWLTVLESINKMNTELSVPRAYAITDSFEHALVFDFPVTIGESLSPRTLVEAYRFFEASLRRAVTFYDGLLR